MNKILSIIVPSYNMEAYLPKCLGSLVTDDKELFNGLDVIVVNDGSNDRTSEIAHVFDAKYPGVFRVIDKQNGHYGSCINAALPVARGQFVKILDADDWIETSNLGGFIRFLCDLGGGVDLVLSDYDTVRMDGSVSERHTYAFPKDRPFGFNEFLRNESYLSMHAYAYRTEMLLNMGYQQLEGFSYTDTEWTMVPMSRVKSFRYFPDVIYKYLRGREGQTMAPDVRAKHFWMQTEVYLHIAAQIEKIKTFASDTAREAVETRLLNCLYETYRQKVFKDGLLPEEFGLKRFDDRLRSASPKFYMITGNMPYSRWLPYHFIRAWRKESLMLPAMVQICKLYSRIAKLLAG